MQQDILRLGGASSFGGALVNVLEDPVDCCMWMGWVFVERRVGGSGRKWSVTLTMMKMERRVDNDEENGLNSFMERGVPNGGIKRQQVEPLK
jgi:hypothetical protein